MTALFLDSSSPNPLDKAEQLIMDREWACDRPYDEELVAEVTSGWCNYRIWFTWQAELGTLIFSCGYDTRIPEAHRKNIYPLLASINEKMWMGHFDICSEEGSITYRQSLLLRGTQGASQEQIEDLIDNAVNECDRFYPAFQSVLWGGKSLTDAVDIAMMGQVGEA